MSDKITQAREFLANFLNKNNFTLAEHSAVLAMVEYIDENSGPISETIPVTETNEYKALQENGQEHIDHLKTLLGEKTTEHDVILKQRDHNWNELQKTIKENAAMKVTVASLETPIPTAKEVSIPEVAAQDEPVKKSPGRPKNS